MCEEFVVSIMYEELMEVYTCKCGWWYVGFTSDLPIFAEVVCVSWYCLTIAERRVQKTDKLKVVDLLESCWDWDILCSTMSCLDQTDFWCGLLTLQSRSGSSLLMYARVCIESPLSMCNGSFELGWCFEPHRRCSWESWKSRRSSGCQKTSSIWDWSPTGLVEVHQTEA